MIFAFYSSILEIITQFAIINSIKRGSKNEKEKLMFKYCHSWYCPKKLVWKAHAGRFSPLFSLLLRKCLWGLKRSLVCFLLDIIYTFKKKKKVSQEFEWKFITAFPHNGEENKPLRNAQLGDTPPRNAGKQFWRGTVVLSGSDNSDRGTCGIASPTLISIIYLFQCSIRILHFCITSYFCLILL